MENEKIIEQIVQGMNYYLETLAIPSHIEKYSDEMCSWIKPKEGIPKGPAGVYKLNFEGKTDGQIKETIQRYKEKGIVDYWFTTPLSKPKHLNDLLLSMGLTVNDDLGMAIPSERLAHASWAEMKQNSSVPVKKVTNREDFNIWTDIINKALFEEGYINSELYYPLCESGRIICFLGYSGETPVATSMTLMTDNKIGRLEWISTLSEYRKKGIGAALCCIGIEQLINDGACIVTLNARAMGVSLYKSLGFEVYY